MVSAMNLFRKTHAALDSVADTAEEIAGLTPLVALALAAVLAVSLVALTVGIVALGRTRDE